MKLLWTGSDAYFMNNLRQRPLRKRPYWIMIRFIVRVLDLLQIECHLTNAWWIRDELKQFRLKRPIEIMLTPLKYTEKFKKKPHKTPNILYYKPPRSDIKWRNWLYGIDLIDRLQVEFESQVNFIEVDQSYDMSEIFPIVDLYIRPNRHDGYSRLIRECDIQDIPYYWSHENPDYDRMAAMVKELIKTFYQQ